MLEVPSHPLPTLPSLGVSSLPDSISSTAAQIAQKWLSDLESALSSSKPDLSNLLVEDSFWRDMLALTWDFRTFNTIPSINSMLAAQAPKAHPRNFVLRNELLGLQQPYPDVAWVHLMFDFETDEGVCFGIARLVPVPAPKGGLDWKAHVVFTNLEALKGFPEKIGSLRNHAFNHGLWEAQRKREREFRDGNPQVLIIGAGQSGLELAARLKALDVSTLLVERNERIGDNWRKRYEALCLHDPVWYDHMPYLPFPPTWPVYTPAMKLADWLESYAHHMELNVWTSSTITSVKHKDSGKWDVEIETKEGEKRKFEVNHVVFATGLGSGVPNTPKYPGMDEFKGEILHSSEHKRALDHAGKKVLVVGACTSAHDIAVDYYNHGVDVTMFQRSSTYIMSCKNGWKVLFEGVYSENAPPVDIADRLNASYPHYMSVGLNQRRVQTIAEMDNLDGLNKVGFRTNFGIEGSGFGLLAWSKAGGYYLDTGASKLISEGKIKLKNDALIESFTPTGIKFDNGETMDVDVVVFATGLGDPVEHIRRLCGSSVADKCGPIWGLDKEGEINGVWRDLGVKGLWYMMGNLALCRFHSKHVALQIKAIEEGVLKERYA